jgi:membrane-associated phospholipid phosphatase
VQTWASSQRWLIHAADWMYLNSHFVVTFGALAFLYLRRNDAFYFVRNMFLVAMGLALLGYALYPTAPPRLMPEWGFTDSVAAFTGVRVENEPVSALLNLYAAVPSMHVCFALMVGWPLARLVRPRPLKLAWLVYPFLVTFVVVATGNHYFFDAILGAMTAGISALLSHQLLARGRPQAWSFRRARVEATA